jgi:SpoIIAA-like
MTADAALEGDRSRRVDLYFSRRGVADVIWDANWNVVHIEAKGWADTAESHAVLDEAIRAMTDHQGSRWLFDGREMNAIKQSDLRWITEVWLPRALAAGLRVAAIVMPTSDTAMKNVDDMAKAAEDEIEVRYFSSVENAREWLAVSAQSP